MTLCHREEYFSLLRSTPLEGDRAQRGRSLLHKKRKGFIFLFCFCFCFCPFYLSFSFDQFEQVFSNLLSSMQICPRGRQLVLDWDKLNIRTRPNPPGASISSSNSLSSHGVSFQAATAPGPRPVSVISDCSPQPVLIILRASERQAISERLPRKEH